MELSTKVAASIMITVLSVSAGVIGAASWRTSSVEAINSGTPYMEKSVVNVNYLLKDKKPPVIAADNQRVVVNTRFDPKEHVVVTDAQDGDITSKVQVYGSVDVDTKGIYDIRYVVWNSYGLKSEKKIRVIVD